MTDWDVIGLVVGFVKRLDHVAWALSAFISNLNNNKLTVEEIVKIEQYFGMSRKATLFRLKKDVYNILSEESDIIE